MSKWKNERDFTRLIEMGDLKCVLYRLVLLARLQHLWNLRWSITWYFSAGNVCTPCKFKGEKTHWKMTRPTKLFPHLDADYVPVSARTLPPPENLWGNLNIWQGRWERGGGGFRTDTVLKSIIKLWKYKYIFAVTPQFVRLSKILSFPFSTLVYHTHSISSI